MKNRALDYFLVALGAFFLSLSVRLFLLPQRISTGGVSGVATLLYYFFSLPLSVTSLGMNLFLFFFAFHTLPRKSLKKNLVGILLFSLFLFLTEGMKPPETDLFLSCVFGGMLAGIGVGLALLRDASTGGTDLAALVLSKRFPHLSPAFFITVTDSGIILLSGLLFGEIAVTLYSLISLFLSNLVVDRILVRGDFAKAVTVVTRKGEGIVSAIHEKLGRGVTGLPAKMYYSKKEGTVLFCVVRPRQVQRLLKIVEEADRDAFTVVSDVKKVRGLGFSPL